MNNFKKLYKMTCEEAQLLMVPMWADTFGFVNKEKQSFEAHLAVCQVCTKEYEETKILMSLVKKYWGPISSETQQLLEQADYKVVPTYRKRLMTVEEGWQDLCQRCPDLAESTEKPKSLQLFLHIGAVAACLVIGVLMWIIFSNYSKPHVLPQNSSSQQVASAHKPSVKVELVTNTGNIPIPSGQQVISASQLKTLLINGKHLMTMNTNTVLAVEPLVENSNIGCLVKLVSGQIYIHVEHEGNPFIVDTANGKAVITGTIFDVKAKDDSTTLVVNEGTVKFESESGVVKVAAGQTSEIVGQSAPSIPLSCNTTELTAWATGYKTGPALTKTELNPDPWDLPLSFGEKPIVFAETDYKQWVEQKREWFKKDFPWIFELKDALVRERIKVDYPELLIKSGDAWQFVCLQKFPARFSLPDFESLLKAANSYGFGKKWVLKNVPTAKMVQNRSLLLQNPTGSVAFEQWLKYVQGKEETPSPYYSADACKYLTETRSLIWFAVKEGRIKVQNIPRTLELLSEEVVICSKLFEKLNPFSLESESKSISQCDKPAKDMEKDISIIAEYESIIKSYRDFSIKE